jgi:hypothetical protein
MAPKAYTKLPNARLHTDERFRGACGAPPSLAGEPSVGQSHVEGRFGSARSRRGSPLAGS